MMDVVPPMPLSGPKPKKTQEENGFQLEGETELEPQASNHVSNHAARLQSGHGSGHAEVNAEVNTEVNAESEPQALSLVPDAGHLDVESFLIELADALNSTLDLQTILSRVAELVKRVIPYEIFAILLLNEKTQELRMRFQIGHAPEVDRIRIRVGKGVTGRCVELREPVLVNDVLAEPNYINAHPSVRSELAVPLILKGKVIGVIDIQSAVPGYFQPEHRRLLTLIASRVAVSVENARLYTRVYRNSKTLEVLNEISRELTSILNLDELLRRIGDQLVRVIDYQMFSILLLDESQTILQHRFSLRFNENVQLKHDIPVDRGLVGAAVTTRKAVLATDVARDERYIQLNPETRSELCVPLVYKDKAIGVLDLEHTRRNYFNDDHVRTMTTLAAQVAIAIENARLYERIAREEQRLERDLSMAREIQQRMLPPCCPVMRNAEVAASFVPASKIGGDIYDFLEYSGGQVGIAVGDVSGKGAAAALFAAMVGGVLRSTSGAEPSPSEMLTAINASLNERPIEAQFVAMLYALWDDGRQMMRIANSGQPRPIYCHHGRTEVVESTGLPLGLFDDAEYDEVTIHGQPGDAFVLFSDGITDAVNARGERFGQGRVEELVRTHCDLSADGLVGKVFDAVKQHAAGTAAFDDETVVVIKIRGDAATTEKVETARKTLRTRGSLRQV